MGKPSGGGGDVFPGNTREAQALINMQEAALGRASQRTAGLNLFDRFTPFGSQQFIGRPGSANFREVIKLDPREQSLFNQGQNIRLGLQDFAQQQLPQLGGVLGSPVLGGQDLTDSAGELERATFERGESLLRPGFERDQERLENQLLQRGLPRSSEAAEEETRALTDRQNLALENLALSSVGAGRAEQSRLLGADLARRGGIINEIGALGTGQPVTPSFQPTPQIGQQSADVLGPFGQLNANVAQQNQLSQQNKQQNTGALSSIASAALIAGMFACSQDFKTDNEPVEPVLDRLDRLKVENWRYRWGADPPRHIGPYAEQFHELFGVGEETMINPVDAFGICLKAIQELRAEVKELKNGS